MHLGYNHRAEVGNLTFKEVERKKKQAYAKEGGDQAHMSQVKGGI